MSRMSRLTKAKWKTYKTKGGDTLSQIAQSLYGDWKKWPLIWSANRGPLSNPDVVPSGITLTIPEDRNLNEVEKEVLEKNIQKWKTKREQPKDFSSAKTEDVEQVLEQQELVDLTKYNIPIKSSTLQQGSKYCHPQLAKVLITLHQHNLLNYVSEAFPSTVAHNSQAHKTGRAIDFTLTDPSMSEAVCNWLNENGYKCLDEYKVSTTYKTGDHIHLEV